MPFATASAPFRCWTAARAHLSELLHVPVRQILERHPAGEHLRFDPLHFFGIPEEEFEPWRDFSDGNVNGNSLAL